MVHCSVLNCFSSSKNKVTFYYLPKEPEIHEKWLDFLQKSGKQIQENAKYCICQNHFLPLDIKEGSARKLLKPGTVPSILNAQDPVEGEPMELEPNEEQPGLNDSLMVTMDRRITDLEAELKKERKKSAKLADELTKTRKELFGIKKFLTQDQLDAMKGKTIRKWSNSAFKKAILVKTKGGSQLLNFVRHNIAPLPSCSAIIRKLSDIKMSPGVLDFNIKTLAADTKDLTGSDKHFVLIFDEKAIVPGSSYDKATGENVGLVTLPPSSEKAVNAMVVLAAGIGIRFKRAVGLHFMGKKIDAKKVKDFLVEVIATFEGITGCFVDAIIFDLGPHNIQVCKELGLQLKKGSNECSIIHPNDSSRLLYLIPDPVHSAKCLASGIRRSDVKIPEEFVQKYNLSSNTAKIRDVEKLFNIQKGMDYKPGPGLTAVTLNPDHFEVMNIARALELTSEDVTSAMGEIFNEEGGKRNATGWLLETLNKWIKSVTNSVYNNIDELEGDVEFLEEFQLIIDTIQFKSRVKHQTGAVWSSKAIIELGRFHLGNGVPFFKTSRLTQNALENIFSQTDSHALKPSAYHFMYSLRAVTLCQTLFNRPVKGSSYEYEEEQEHGVCFFKLLAEARAEKKEGEEEVFDDEEEGSFEPLDVPSTVLAEDLFPKELERNAYKEGISKLFKKYQIEDSQESKALHLKLEWIFNAIRGYIADAQFKKMFDFHSSPLKTDENSAKIIAKFLPERMRLLKSRDLHSANKFASKSLT